MRGSVLIAVVALGVVACGTSDPSQDPARCQQTFEFGNTGCAELTGIVTDHLGAPTAGVYVTAELVAEPARAIDLVSGSVQTDATGAYRLRTIRMAGDASVPDTVTVWVRASVEPAPTLPPGTPGSRDSVPASIEIRPVGELPAVTAVAAIAIAGL